MCVCACVCGIFHASVVLVGLAKSHHHHFARRNLAVFTTCSGCEKKKGFKKKEKGGDFTWKLVHLLHT